MMDVRHALEPSQGPPNHVGIVAVEVLSFELFLALMDVFIPILKRQSIAQRPFHRELLLMTKAY